MQRIVKESKPNISSHSLKNPTTHYFSSEQLHNPLEIPLSLTQELPPETISPLNKFFKIDRTSLTLYGSETKEEVITIQNIGKQSLKITITVPKTKYFAIKEEHRSFILAAGMSKKVTIQLSKIPNDFSCLDFVNVQTEKLSEKIELNWYRMRPTTEYSTLIDFGKIEAGKIHNFSVQFKNKSKFASRKINLTKDPLDNIQIQPDSFKIKPLEGLKVELVLIPQVQGVYHHKIVVEEEGNLQAPIEIVYSAINCAYRIEEDNGIPARDLDFGTLLKGTKKQQFLWAHNSGPRDVELKIKVKIGRSLRAQSSLQSPQQLGVECSSTVIQPANKNMKILAFSKIKIPLIAYLSVQQKEFQLVERLAKSQNLSNSLLARLEKEDTQHQEVLVCEFYEGNKTSTGLFTSKPVTLVVPMRVSFSLPALKISPCALYLGTIPSGTSVKSSLNIDNLSCLTKFTLQVGKILNSECFLLKSVFNSKESQVLDIVTKGGNLGQFKNTLTLTVAYIYIIKIPVEYEVVASEGSFGRENRLLYTAFEENTKSDPNFTGTLSIVQREKNKEKYGVPVFRRLQVKSKSSLSLFQPQTNTSLRNSSTRIRENVSKEEKEEDCLLNEKRMPSAYSKKYPLFVTRKIDKYYPFQEVRETKKLQKLKNCKDYFGNQAHRQPKNRKEAEQIQRQLTPEELKSIVIGEKVVSFGRLFVKSQSETQWTIMNETQGSIHVQLKDNTTDPKKSVMIANSDFEPQVVPAQGAARFKIAFQAVSCGKFQNTLIYTLNKIHTFQLLITAEVELVTLTPSKTSLKMSYAEENDLLLSDCFHLKNEGNTAAFFSISQANERFKISPFEGEVPAGESKQITVIESQKLFPVVQAGEIFGGKNSKVISGGSQFEERILIKINDGNDISLKATAQPGLADPRCLVREQKLNFGCSIVSKEKEKSFQLKNLSRCLSIFQILSDDCSDFLTFDCTKGRIPPEGTKQIAVTYKSGVIQTINSFFRILIRGGLIINLPISAESIAPEISITQSNFSFGEICYDTASIRPINIRNNSQIAVQLFLDTTGKEKGTQYLSPSFWGASSQPIKEGYVPKKTIVGSSTYGKGTGVEEQIIDNAIHEPNMHKIKIESKSIYTFHLVFKPSAPGYYQFLLPIYLEGLIRNDSLSKVVSCLVIEPRFIVEPPIIRFKTKIINDKDNGCFHPFVEFLTLKNPTNQVLKWKLDMGVSHKTGLSFISYSSMSALGSRSGGGKQMISQQKSCFQIEEKRGELRPRQSVSINVSFNPIEEGAYYHKVPLHIYNEEKGVYQQQSEVRLEGEGKYPSLYFNCRELILPAVPLGIQAIGMFEVYNDGYESINIKHRFEITDLQGNTHVSRGNFHGDNGLPQLSLFFPQESKLTLNKPQLIVMAKFVSKKQISLTCKLQLYDDTTDCRIYSLPLSATADNSLLTTFSYLSDPQNIYKLETVPLDLDKRKKVEDTYTIGLKSNDGRNLIDRYHSHYDELSPESLSLSCRIVKRWINNFLREERVRQFPTDLAQNSDILLKLLQRLTGRKEFDNLSEVSSENGYRDSLHSHTTPSKMAFYQNIVRQLKQFGCLLNHIRPEFLLEKEEFIQIMSRDPGWKYYSSYYIKNQPILHNQAWLILIYQLKTQFWCQRQKLQPILSKPQSNVYSIPELLVLRWVKSCYEAVNELEEAKDRFISFGKDYKDCVAPIHCLLRYDQPLRKGRTLEELHKRPITSTEFTQNTRLLYQLLQRLNIVPLIYEDEYQSCSDKQIFLFMYQLYELLPQILPKGSPIVFSCELGETTSRMIEIKNPSLKTVHYWVKIEGSKDFQVQEKECISIEPKSSYNFSVDFKGRLSVQQVAYLSFFSKQEGESNSVNGTAMVFELRSKIIGRKSSKVIQPICCPLYDSVCIKVLVENIFEESEVANFALSIFEQNLDLPPLLPARKTTQNSQDLEMNAESKPLCQFHCDTETIKIKRGSAAALQLYFNPVRLGRAKCLLVFHDPTVGEFQYEVTGTTEIPRPLQELRISQPLIVGKKQSVELSLPVYNNYMLKCETLLDQRNTDKAVRKDKPEQYFKIELNMDPKILEHINFPREVMLRGAKKESPENNKIRLDCNFTSVLKDLSLDFLLLGDPRRDIQDVRRFKVALNIQHAPIIQDILMTTPARKALSQPIPIENSTTKDWKIKVAITEDQHSNFTLKQGEKMVSKELVVRKGQSQSFNIYFQPKWVGFSTSKVIIHNTTTNEQIILSLKGIAEEPLSEDHIHIRAGTEQSTLHTVTISNPYSEQITYRVICDLEELQLPVDITLEPNQTAPFNIYARSEGGGSSQVGYIKFVDKEGRFFWYSVVLESAEKKVREFTVELSGQVGNIIEKFVEFKNPFSKALSYKVQYPKGVGLQVKEEFVIYSHGTYQLRIRYCPERPSEQDAILKATSHDIGVFLYRIKLIARDQNKKKAIQLSSEVGKTGHFDIKLDNPRKDEIRINYTLTNHACFVIDGPQVLQPGENTSTIKFTPTTEGREICSIRISGENFPTRCIEVEGTGLAPYMIETIHFRTRPGQSALEVIRFTNPNSKRSTQAVKVCLSEAQHGFFKVVGREGEGDWVTEVKDLLVVPVEFLPQTKGYFQSVLTIQCFHYQWKYLLKGTTNFHEVERIQEEIKAANKEEVIKRLKVPVPQYYGQPPSYFDKITLDHPNKHILRLIRSWFKLKLNNHCEQENDEKIVTALLKFRPKKQLKQVVKLVLSNSKEQGPTLVYTIQLTVTEAAPDSCIRLQIDSIKTVVFDLHGLGPQGTKQLKMVKGNYCEVERKGDSVKLKFKPTHLLFKNTKVYTDNLLLQNDEEEWNYEIQFALQN